jgi:quinone-modifying oxidoreductase subunit QmoC
LAAIRARAVQEYAVPKKLGQMVNDPKKLPILLLIPVIIFLVVGMITGLLDLTPEGSEIIHSHFFSTWLVDLIFVPLSIWTVAIFAMGAKNFMEDVHKNAVADGKVSKKEFSWVGIVSALPKVILKILRHDKFVECGENKERATSHMMVLFGFIGLLIVTSIFFVVLYIFQIHGPYSQLNPVKWLANVSGVALVIGAAVMLKQRMSEDKSKQTSSYKDWALLGLVLGLGATGLLTEMTRLGGLAFLSYLLYFIHLVFVFALFAYLPFSKLAHLVYRTLAMAYSEYAGREASVAVKEVAVE